MTRIRKTKKYIVSKGDDKKVFYTQTEIADYLKTHFNNVSRVVRFGGTCKGHQITTIERVIDVYKDGEYITTCNNYKELSRTIYYAVDTCQRYFETKKIFKNVIGGYELKLRFEDEMRI